jgi:hypothetical protein
LYNLHWGEDCPFIKHSEGILGVNPCNFKRPDLERWPFWATSNFFNHVYYF